jgi:2-oxoglutarate ferredoxin oxidoreductase subunit alpha
LAKETFTFLVGGKAGEGVKKAGQAAAALFSGMGRHVFQADEYESLIKGGHNFSTVTTGLRQVTGTYLNADLVVCLDRRSYDIHKDHLAPGGALVFNSDAMGPGNWKGSGLPLTSSAKKFPNPELRMGLGAVAALLSALGMDRADVMKLVKEEYSRDLESNLQFALAVHELASPQVGRRFALERGDRKRPMLFGNQAIVLGAYLGGLDAYFAYPMTPSSSALHYIAGKARELYVTVVQPESEIAVMNMALGAAFTGARSMIGTAGGGFGLMVEALSMAGMAEVPVLCLLASRVGPSTGSATLHEQSDLRFALGAGHGEFPRIVASPATVKEALFLSAELLDLAWKFQVPAILLTEKHLCESTMTADIDPSEAAWSEPAMHPGGEYKRYRITDDGVSPLLFPPSRQLVKWTSHMCDETGLVSEDPGTIAQMHEKFARKGRAIEEKLRQMHAVNVYGGEGRVVMTYGSTTMAVVEALRFGGLKARVVQPVYLEPFPEWALGCSADEKPIVVEQSSTGLFARLVEDRTGVEPEHVIKKYDGRPFDPEQLASQLREVL